MRQLYIKALACSMLFIVGNAFAQSSAPLESDMDNTLSDEAYAAQQCSQWAQEDGLQGSERAQFIEECIVDILSESEETAPETSPEA